MGKAIQIDSTMTGPFWDHGKAELTEAGRAWIQDMLTEGQAKVEAQLYPGHGVVTGAYKSTIHSQIKSSVWGEIGNAPDRQTSLIGAWLEGSRNRSEAARFKGYGMFRKTKSHLRRLANELAGKVYSRMTKRLT